MSNPTTRNTTNNALHHLCLVSESTLIFATNVSLPKVRSCSPLMTVLNKLGDTYQAYCNTYKTYAMATCHGGVGQPSVREDRTARNEIPTNIPQDSHPEDTDTFEGTEHINPTILAKVLRQLDALQQKFQIEEGQLTEHLQCIE